MISPIGTSSPYDSKYVVYIYICIYIYIIYIIYIYYIIYIAYMIYNHVYLIYNHVYLIYNHIYTYYIYIWFFMFWLHGAFFFDAGLLQRLPGATNGVWRRRGPIFHRDSHGICCEFQLPGLVMTHIAMESGLEIDGLPGFTKLKKWWIFPWLC